ncbi:hypothetical protein EMPG_10127 [Blastomyces silverae]|uniref:Uncharacterized protein n=1 Tax=Blastomyces silverae TaxID=2060906 RepID=A0A0H1B518_9EURO|nr:hypothetical protein EMPG_10127 [Blastomyces silverae]
MHLRRNTIFITRLPKGSANEVAQAIYAPDPSPSKSKLVPFIKRLSFKHSTDIRHNFAVFDHSRTNFVNMSQPPQAPPGSYDPAQAIALTSASKANTKMPHLIETMDYMIQLLQANSVSFALMGGLAMAVLGSNRNTHDVDLAVGCNMEKLKQIATANHHRIRRPAGPMSGVYRLFVKVGREGDPICPVLWTQVDLILQGSLGAPDDPQSVSQTISFTVGSVQKHYPVLNLSYMMASKLAAHSGRGETADMNDILFLIQKYAQQLYEVRVQLNQRHRQAFINALIQKTSNSGIIKKAKFTLGVV